MFKMGMRDWRSSWKKTWRFVAVGIVAAATLSFFGNLATQVIPILSPLRVVAVSISTLLSGIISFLIAVAVWEYYSRVVRTDAEIHSAPEVNI
ncbi:MAG TPA: hypothetical protein VGK34_05055 [Armatimonadota bacterium]|jgi:membrane protein implicated in regulation of membrane protease activity